MYKRVLVATDGSKTAVSALGEACTLARGAAGARLRIVHVVDSPHDYADAWYSALSVSSRRKAGRSAGRWSRRRSGGRLTSS
jgi:nucleotide-binding universal stress UspA family protein